MADSIGLIERAAALLRQRDALAPGSVPIAAPPTAPAAERRAAMPSADRPAAAVDGAAADAAAVDAAVIGGVSTTRPELVLDRGRLAGHGVAVPSSQRSRTVEEFRLVKRNLMTGWSAGTDGEDRRESRLIMVTSARPGEGKTFVSLNLALAFASERDVKALLVDVDTHHSTLRSILGIPGEAGIVDLLAGDLDLCDVLVRTNNPNLLLLPSGRGGPHVPELFSSNRMGALMTELGRRFPDRFIILDTPPCMASSDAATLAPLVGQIVFVVEAYRTQQDEIEASLGMLGACARISLVLNKGELSSAHFGSYGYGYHYPGGEGDELRSDAPART